MFNMTFDDKLYFGPIDEDLKHALDIGTGTGIWAIDFADDHAACQVIGTDLAPTQPSFVPPNLQFLIEDAEDNWVYEHKFEYIHLRLMAGSFKRWQKVRQSCFDALELGGWLEFQDYVLPCEALDDSYAGTNLDRWSRLMLEGAAALGHPMDTADQYAKMMREVGFAEIVEQQFIWPTNPWPRDQKLKELGRWNEMNMVRGLSGFSLHVMTHGLNWTKDEVGVFVAKVWNDMRDRKIHAYFRLPVVYGRKPL